MLLYTMIQPVYLFHDVIGDLYLLGPIEGHVIALKSSHELNSRLAHSIIEEIRETQQ